MISMTFTGPPCVKSCRFLQSRPRQSRRVDSEEFRFVASLGWRNKEAAFNDQSGEPECRTCFSSPPELEVGPNSKFATLRLAGDDLLW